MEVWEAAYIAGIIDGEGSISLTRMNREEHRRPCISIASTDYELLTFIQSTIGGVISNKKNYNPKIHKASYTLVVKTKDEVFNTLECIVPFLRITKKKNRALFILDKYNKVTPRNGKYSKELLEEKLLFEDEFFNL
ncbi:LAGLIDADG family homing endonuclease [Bacillus sp. AK128]